MQLKRDQTEQLTVILWLIIVMGGVQDVGSNIGGMMMMRVGMMHGGRSFRKDGCTGEGCESRYRMS